MENSVEIWLGNFKDQAEINSYLHQNFNSNEDILPSNFMQDFNISSYDNDFQEAFCGIELFGKASITAVMLLERLSYSNTFLSEVLKDITMHNFNSVIALYNFEYHEQVIQVGRVFYIGKYFYSYIA